MTRPRQSILAVFAWVRRYWMLRPKSFVGVVVFVAVSVLLEVQIPALAAELVRALQETGANPDMLAEARSAALWLVAFFAFVSIAQQVYLRLWIHLAADVMRHIVNDGFAAVQRFATDWHANHFAGSTVRRITRGMWAYDSFSDVVVVDLGPALALLVGFAVAMTLRDPWMGAYFAAAVVVFVTISVVMSLYYVAPANVVANDADTFVGGSLADAITCNATVKSFGREAHEDARLSDATGRWHQLAHRSWRRSIDTGALQSLMIVLLLGGLLALVLTSAEQGGLLEDLVYVLTTYFLVNSHLRNIGRQVRELQRAANEIDDLVEIDAMPPQIADAPSAPDFQPGPGEVRIEQVGFRYPNARRAVFSDLDLHIEAGERVALVGPSGAGKTTLVKLVQRLHDVGAGRVLIDGQDIREVTQASLRRAVALVPQEPILFHRSLAENIGYGRADAGFEQIVEAAQRAHAHDFISGLPDGYDTLVGERGVKLSGGERQRVAIARAMLADAPVLILDEATSSLDSVTEHKIQLAIEALLEARTAIMIAHRLSTIRQADRIVVFDGGRIVEEGRHETLMSTNGVYRRLYDMQALGFSSAEDGTSDRSAQVI